MRLEAHPLAERYPLMDTDTFAAFKADVQANGCREPVRKFQGKILDGRNRYRACVELGIETPLVEFQGTEEDAAKAVDSWNLHRRHLTVEFRRQKVAELRAEGMSQRQIADTLKIPKSTVADDIKAGARARAPAPPGATPASPSPVGRTIESQTPVSPPPQKVKGRDGKSYPTTKPNVVPKVSTQKEPHPPQPEVSWQDAFEALEKAVKLLWKAPPPDRGSHPELAKDMLHIFNSLKNRTDRITSGWRKGGKQPGD